MPMKTLHLLKPQDHLIELGGPETLKDVEILAALLGNSKQDLELAHELLKESGYNLYELAQKNFANLKLIKGLSERKALVLASAWELARRRELANLPEKIVIKESQSVYQLLAPKIRDLSHEEFWIILLNRANQVLQTRRVSIGGLTGTVVDIKQIICLALAREKTAALIACHNHPSGNTEPSEADKTITKRLAEAAKLLDLKLFDHVIIAQNKYFSFADQGLI